VADAGCGKPPVDEPPIRSPENPCVLASSRQSAMPAATDLEAKDIQRIKAGLLSRLFTGNGLRRDFFKAKVNFPTATLAILYRLSGVTGDQPQHVENMVPNRQGFLGLAGFLTIS